MSQMESAGAGLTETQRIFARAYARGDVAMLARFKSHEARYLSIPAVLAAIHSHVQSALIAEAPLSLAVLRKLRDDKETPARTRADISIKLLALAGHVAPTTPGAGAPEKQLSEMSADELHAYLERNRSEIDRLESELATRAKEVNAPNSAPPAAAIEDKPLQYLD